MDYLVYGLHLDLHQKAHAVVYLYVGLHVVIVQVAVDYELRHVRGEAGDQLRLADHVGVVV